MRRILAPGAPALCGQANALDLQQRHASELRELLNVSQLDVVPTPREGGTVAWISTVRKADGQKCERCWHWETDIGAHADHPTICYRCVEAVQGKATAR